LAEAAIIIFIDSVSIANNGRVQFMQASTLLFVMGIKL